MIRFLLQELEKVPHPTFSKNELLKISRKEFNSLKNNGILAYRQPDSSGLETIRYPRCPHGCGLTVQETEFGYEAACLNHPEEDPILVEEGDLPRYEYKVDALLEQVRSANEISGGLQTITGNLLYMGCKTIEECKIGFVFIRSGELEWLGLMGLKHIWEKDDVLIVLTPVTLLEVPILKSRLGQDQIIPVSLATALDFNSYKLPLDSLLAELFTTEANRTDEVFTYSPNYSRVTLNNNPFDLNELQAKVIAYLHVKFLANEYWVKQPDMKDAVFGKDAIYQRKLGEIFRGNKKALEALIAYKQLPGGNKDYTFIRLNIPQTLYDEYMKNLR